MFDDKLGREFESLRHNRKDPDPWLALFLDNSVPIDVSAKAALLRGNDSYSRRFFLPACRPVIFVFFIFVQILRRFFQSWPNSPKLLHDLIHWGLKTFATPDANYLILRHFQVGTEILNFIKDNAPVDNDKINTVPLRPTTLADLKDNVFLQHDLNVYNFIIDLSNALMEQDKEIQPAESINFDSISNEPFEFEAFPDGPLNFVDIQTAIEFYTPVYALLLSRHDFVRAANSLQLDETFAVYIAKILGTDYHMSFVQNHHPMVPLSPFQAGFRLMMHGYDAEALHGYLRYLKKEQERDLSKKKTPQDMAQEQENKAAVVSSA